MPIRFESRTLVSLKSSPYLSLVEGKGVLLSILTHTLDEKFERNPMRFACFLIEVEAVHRRVSFFCVLLLFRYHLGIQSDEVIHISDRVVFEQLFVYFATVSFVYSDVLHDFVVNVRFLLQADEEVADRASFGNKDVEGFLINNYYLTTFRS